MSGPIVSYHPTIQGDENFLLFSQRPLNQGDRQAISRAGAVLLPQVCREDLFALVQEMGRPHFPRPDVHLTEDGKVGNRRLFKRLGLPHPPSLEFPHIQSAAEAWEQGRVSRAGLISPLVAKGAGGGMGENVFLIGSAAELRALEGRLETGCYRGPDGLVLQQYVECGCRDARVVLMGEYHDAFWRVGPAGEFRSNLSQGGKVLRPEHDSGLEAARDLALRLQRAAGLDLAAVDLLIPPGREPLILEINFYFGREALGGTIAFNTLYLGAVQAWLSSLGLDPDRVSLD